MKSTMIVAVMLMLATAAYAVPALNVELVYPTSTTWELWGNLVENTAGLAGVAVEVSGIETKETMLPTGNAIKFSPYTNTTVGFGTGVDVAQAEPGTWQLFKGQDTQVSAGLLYEVGVTAQTITSWPGADMFLPNDPPLSFGMPVLMFRGTRVADAPMAVNYDEAHSLATAFTAVGATTTVEIPVIPEPATLALLALGGLAALRRRR